MRRRILLIIPLTVALLVVAGIFVSEAQRTPEWQTRLDSYLSTHGGVIRQVIRARAPENLTDELVVRTDNWGDFRGLALPQPPRKVYCVQLEAGQARSLLFASYYSDNLWRDDWLIQAGPNFPLTPSGRTALARLGCDFAAQGDVR